MEEDTEMSGFDRDLHTEQRNFPCPRCTTEVFGRHMILRDSRTFCSVCLGLGEVVERRVKERRSGVADRRLSVK
jgi:hypothetical protein